MLEARLKFIISRPGFYVTFWQLSTYDLAPPGSKYDEEGAALRMLSRSEDSKYIAADRSADRAKRLTAGAHRSRRDRYNVFVNTLAQEFKEQTVSREFTMKRLGREKQHWFAHCKFVYTMMFTEPIFMSGQVPRVQRSSLQ